MMDDNLTRFKILNTLILCVLYLNYFPGNNLVVFLYFIYKINSMFHVEHCRAIFLSALLYGLFILFFHDKLYGTSTY